MRIHICVYICVLILHDIHSNGLGPNWGYFESLGYLLGKYMYINIYDIHICVYICVDSIYAYIYI
jgi:hypothetical protein